MNAATKNNPDADPEFIDRVKEVILAHDQVVPTRHSSDGRVVSPATPVSLEAKILLEADHVTGEVDKLTGIWQTIETRLQAIKLRWVERDHVITSEEFENMRN